MSYHPSIPPDNPTVLGYDHYDTGSVLLEISFWRRLKVASDGYPLRRQRIFRLILIEKHAPLLGRKMRRAGIQRCRGGMPKRRVWGMRLYIRVMRRTRSCNFVEKVDEPLEELSSVRGMVAHQRYHKGAVAEKVKNLYRKCISPLCRSRDSH